MRRLLPIALASFSCVPNTDRTFDVDPEANTLVAVIANQDDTKAWVDVASVDEPMPIALAEGDSVTVHQYAETTEELRIERGAELEPFRTGCPLKRAVPEPLRRERFVLESNQLLSTGDVETRFGLPAFPYDDCYFKGGCPSLSDSKPGIPICGPCPEMVPPPASPDLPQMLPEERLPPGPCPADRRYSFGDRACVPFSNACGNEDWPDVGPRSGRVYYVLQGSLAPTEDGSMDAPFRRLDVALSQPTPPDVIFLGKGVYQDALPPLSRPVEILACPLDTTVRVPLVVTSSGVVVEGGTWRDGVVVEAGGGLDLARAKVLNDDGHGIQVDGRASLDELVVEAAQDGVRVERGGALSAREMSVVEAQTGVLCQGAGGGKTLDLTRFSFSAGGVALDSRGCFGEVTGAVAGSAQEGGFLFAGANATLSNVHVINVLADGGVGVAATASSDLNVDGLHLGVVSEGLVIESSSVTARHVVIKEARDFGVRSVAGATLVLQDVSIAQAGMAALSLDMFESSLDRVEIGMVDGVAVSLNAPFGPFEATIDDLTVRDSEDGVKVLAKAVSVEANVTMTNAFISASSTGLTVEGAAATLRDVDVAEARVGILLRATEMRDASVSSERVALSADGPAIQVWGPADRIQTRDGVLQELKAHVLAGSPGLEMRVCDATLSHRMLSSVTFEQLEQRIAHVEE